ncbi:hypothetical protein [Roseisolibacter sp. H3M3-2]|uniref:hypothetical protein n=1 Tax=Roseisolibacter sp. H3M3-2 TaxID=3031323 RepID=UPI0023DCA0D3|nr:hypothetical protein [Roseisolibacter sp. H3M3-2]MDF1501917.1 hypothetical protein [Roseisolibacter sp. H3M3-2]
MSVRLLVLGALAVTLSAAKRPSDRTPPPHVDGADGILAVLDSVPLVALVDVHAAAEAGAFYRRLIAHPRFADRVDDVVVEFGNERHQALADRYVGYRAGPPVAADSLRMIWEDNTQGALPTTWAPMYGDVLHAVRAANAARPAGRRVRVLLGDPAVEWRTVTRDALWEIHKRRGDRMRELARDSVLAKGRRGIVIAGGSHVRRVPRVDPATGARADAKWGDLASRVFVVRVHAGFGAPAARHEATMDALPAGALLRVRGTFLAALPADSVDAATPGAPDRPPPPGARSAQAGLSLADVADGYLYLGPIGAMTLSHFDPDRVRRDPARLRELHRRSCMMSGRGVDTTRLFRAPPSPRLFPGGLRGSYVDWEPAGPLPERAPPLPATLPPPCDTLLGR